AETYDLYVLYELAAPLNRPPPPLGRTICTKRLRRLENADGAARTGRTAATSRGAGPRAGRLRVAAHRRAAARARPGRDRRGGRGGRFAGRAGRRRRSAGVRARRCAGGAAV